MSEQRDIDRYKKGREHWNQWAKSRLEARAQLKADGKWAVKGDGQAANDETQLWMQSASVDFSSAGFSGKVEFSGFLFPHTADFHDVNFKGPAIFSEANFSGEALFVRATFHSAARFEKATFSGNARFDRCEFNGIADFSEAQFYGRASFHSASIGGPFSLASTYFHQVPDFIQVSFRASVRVDELQIKPGRRVFLKGDSDKSARWRVLKKIAIEGHDHVREQTFFANEVRERRGVDDKLLSAAFWLGILYGLTSDFGRSIFRPILWLGVIWITFTVIYHASSPLISWPNCTPPGRLLIRALDLSLFNSLPFAGLAKAEQIKEISNCLYGERVLPRGIIRWTVLQSVLSAAMIFLVLLGIRNRFRIK